MLILCQLQDVLSSHSGSSICESDDLQKFKDLTLADLKVMGVIGKVHVTYTVQWRIIVWTA